MTFVADQAQLEVLAQTPQRPVSELKRFAILVLGSFGCICCSLSYAFNLIAQPMQMRYNFTQRDMSTITTVGLAIQYFMLPYAFLYDYIGPTPISILGTLFLCFGTLLLAQCFSGNIQGSVANLSVFNTLMGCGCTLFDLACCMTVLSYFPSNKGAVIALLKTFTGLGSAIVGCIQLGFFGADIEGYFYFLMCIALFVGLLCTAFMRLPPYHLTQYEEAHLSAADIERRTATKSQYLKQKPPTWRFIYGFVILIFLIVFLPMASALVNYLSLGNDAKVAFAVVVTIVTLLFMLVALPFRLPFLEGRRDAEEESEQSSRDADVLSIECGKGRAGSQAGEPFDDAEKSVAAAAPANFETEVDYLAPQYQTTFLQNLCTLRLWAIWWSFFTIVGTEFVIIYNASFILGALAGEMPNSNMRTLLTVLNGVGSAVGRLLMSYFEVWSQKRKAEDRIPLTIALFFPNVSIIITIVLFLTLPGSALPLPYIIAALGNGFLAATIVLTMRTLYAKDVAKHYNFCFLASMMSAIVLNRFLYGEWYAVQADKQGRGDNLCLGKKCVLMPMLVFLGLSLTAFISNVYVHFSYRSYCREVLAERARLREEAAAVAGNDYELENGLEDVPADGSQPREADREARRESL